APDVRVETRNAHRSSRRQALQALELLRRDAELALRPGRAHILVMPVTAAGVDPHDQLASLENLRPRLERIQIVERHERARFEPCLVLLFRREIRREKNALPVDLRKEL